MPSIGDRVERLPRLKPADRETIGTFSAEIRRALGEIAIPEDLASAITRALARLGEQTAYAVRSSATAEDSPTASFAGQHDTYLNIVGPAAILQRVSRCWASLFSVRAVTYRLRRRHLRLWAGGIQGACWVAGPPVHEHVSSCAARVARAPM